jgi:hypothetical protein
MSCLPVIVRPGERMQMALLPRYRSKRSPPRNRWFADSPPVGGVSSEPVSELGFSGAMGFRPDSNTFVDDSGSVRRPFRTRIGRNLGLFTSGRAAPAMCLKLLKPLCFCPSAGLAAGEFTVYKKSASTA